MSTVGALAVNAVAAGVVLWVVWMKNSQPPGVL